MYIYGFRKFVIIAGLWDGCENIYDKNSVDAMNTVDQRGGS